jgi:hypothetical protein
MNLNTISLPWYARPIKGKSDTSIGNTQKEKEKETSHSSHNGSTPSTFKPAGTVEKLANDP